ncbi:MAG: hypothetical protein Ct9H300mP16_04710 [Pseudomonadota bacterium]|nr:MAG: hypothetical protein Ct9H300mP16_04710 [Pseudomonadota bacterium]
MPNGRTASQNDLIGRVDELGPAFAERAAGFDSAARFPTGTTTTFGMPVS